MLIHADGFGLYGTGSTGRTNMLQGVYAEIGTVCLPSSANPRGNGTTHMRLSALQGDVIRRVLGGDYGDGLGFGCAWYLSQLPSSDVSHTVFQARDGSNAIQFTVQLTTTGVLRVLRGNHAGVNVGETDHPVIVAGAYQHIELFAICGNSGSSPPSGSIEIRVNGQTVLNLTDVDIQAQATNAVEQYVYGSPNTSPVWIGTVDVADVHTWDTTGSVNNDFLGDTQWFPFFPISDDTNQGWTPNVTGSGYTQIDEVPPDGETSYVQAPVGSPGAISDYGVTDLPILTTDVIAVVFQPMLRKTDAGDGSYMPSMVQPAVSPDAVANGPDTPLTQVYTYYPNVFETDPSTGVRWTPSGFNSALVRLQRTA